MNPKKEKELIEKIVEVSFEEDNKIIIGDIRLEDVLLSLNKTGRDIGLATNGLIYTEVGESGVVWKMGKPLSQQSEELKEWLWEVICKK